MSALILDAGALVAVDRDDRPMIARLRASERRGLELRTNAMVVAQVWQNQHGRQANLSRLLQATAPSSSPADWHDCALLNAARAGRRLQAARGMRTNLTRETIKIHTPR